MGPLSEDLLRQRSLLAERSPAYAKLLTLLLEHADDPRFAEAWAGRSFSAWYDRPLLLLSALRFDALGDPRHPLHGALSSSASIDPVSIDPVSINAAAVSEALDRHSLWNSLQGRHVQTNEASRAVAWRWPARLLGLRSVVLVDIGASAGLNLLADGLHLSWSDQDGAPLDATPTNVVGRIGYDLRPVRLDDPEAVRWLRACIWPGQEERERRLEAALSLAARLPRLPVLHAAALPDVPGRLDADLSPFPEDVPVLAYQTIVRDYLSAAEREAYTTGMRRWLESPSRRRRLWVELEHHPLGDPCALQAHTAAGEILLARLGYHPERVEVLPGAVEALKAAFWG